MSEPVSSAAKILVASDIVSDANLVKRLLNEEFHPVIVSTDPTQFSADFEQQRPAVLLLAFKSLEKAERYCLSLFRHGGGTHVHRTVVLCAQEDLNHAYRLCREGIFDDYVLFWPMSQDAHRLPMAVHLALQQRSGTAAPLSAELEAQVKQLAELGALLAQQLARGEAQIESLGQVAAQHHAAALAAFEELTQKLARGELLGLADQANLTALQGELGKLQQTSEQGNRAVAASIQPVQQWMNALRAVTAPHMAALHSLNVLASKTQPTLLVVDDDAFQLKLIGSVLSQAQYQLHFASNGVEALDVLGSVTPDLILMDVMLPGIDGMEVVRQIRAAPRLAHLPILMITGHSEKEVVTGSLQAGANGFLVKPFSSHTLLSKVAHALEQGRAAH